jgi:DIS3-like exonuclease 1
VAEITAHLNIMNRRSKAVQWECQKIFFELYLRTRVEEHDAIVYAIKTNGFLAYIPSYDFKGPVFLQDRQGVVTIDPNLVGLPYNTGKQVDTNRNCNPNPSTNPKP